MPQRFALGRTSKMPVPGDSIIRHLSQFCKIPRGTTEWPRPNKQFCMTFTRFPLFLSYFSFFNEKEPSFRTFVSFPKRLLTSYVYLTKGGVYGH